MNSYQLDELLGVITKRFSGGDKSNALIMDLELIIYFMQNKEEYRLSTHYKLVS